MKFTYLKDTETTDVIGGGIGDQSVFGQADRRGVVRLDARITRYPCVGIESGGKIDRDGACVGLAAQGVHFPCE